MRRAPAISRAAQEGSVSEDELVGPEFLLRRPLLEAIDTDEQVVLLIDEIDRADEEFEAFLLEVLSEHQVTIPEIGTVRATHEPYVVLTSNRNRELSEALRRRCLYLWIDYPSLEKEERIVRGKVSGVSDRLAGHVARFVRQVRTERLAKVPGVAESLDWARALVALGVDALDGETVEETLGCFLKDEGDIRAVRAQLATRGVEDFLRDDLA